MLDKLEEMTKRHAVLMEQLANPSLKPAELQTINKERTQLEPLVEAYERLKLLHVELEGNQLLLQDADPDIRDMAREEIGELNESVAHLEGEIKILLLPKDPNDQKNVIVEIRAGTGGDEAALFAGQLFHMYSRFAERMRWKVELMSLSDGSKGGYKEVIAMLSGDQVYAWMKFEAGVHRVQRVPETETQGRIHTSACSVAILPEAEEVDIQIEEKDIRVDVFRAGGPGGQSVNTTDSAVRITHIATGLVVQCQDEKSQLKNKNKAMKVLRARLYEAKQREVDRERAEERKAMVKSGDRSDKIRTYNFPQDRCTDHRVGVTVHNLPKLFAGELNELLSQVRAHFQAQQLSGSAS
ncbi:MAG: peptide chain release factor 1 [Myxococcaceae bacterium]|nr:peptide chain release factor 1 [Myxococcaceae bacterium]